VKESKLGGSRVGSGRGEKREMKRGKKEAFRRTQPPRGASQKVEGAFSIKKKNGPKVVETYQRGKTTDIEKHQSKVPLKVKTQLEFQKRLYPTKGHSSELHPSGRIINTLISRKKL